MERPFGYIIHTSTKELALPYDNYEYLPVAHPFDAIITCIENTHSIYGSDPTITQNLGLAIERLLKVEYNYRFGHMCAIQIRNKRNEIVEKLVDLFGILFTKSHVSKIINKCDHLKNKVIRKLVRVQNGSLIDKMILNKIFKFGIDATTLFDKNNFKKQLFKEKHIYSYSRSHVELFLNLCSNKTLEQIKSSFDDPDHDNKHQLYKTIAKTPIIVRLSKMIKQIPISQDFGFNLYKTIITTEQFTNKHITIMNLVGILIVLEVLNVTDQRVMIDIKRNIVSTICKQISYCKKNSKKILGNKSDSEKSHILPDEKIHKIQNELRFMSQFFTLSGMELIDRRVVMDIFELFDKKIYIDPMNVIKITIDKSITSYDPIPDLTELVISPISYNSDEYIEHLIKHNYLNFNDVVESNIILYLFSIGCVKTLSYLEKFLEYRNIDVMNHPLTGEIVLNLLKYGDISFDKDFISMFIDNKWCFKSDELDRIMDCDIVNAIYNTKNVNLNVETEQDIIKLQNIIRLSSQYDDNYDKLNYLVYRDLMIIVISKMTDYQILEIYRKSNFPKIRKSESLDTYTRRMFDNLNFWKAILQGMCSHNIYLFGLELSPELGEIYVKKSQFTPLLSIHPKYVEWIRNLDDEIIMSSPYYLTRLYLLKVKSGLIYPYNLDKFIDSSTLKYITDYQSGHISEGENNFNISMCSVEDLERITIIKYLLDLPDKIKQESMINND